MVCQVVEDVQAVQKVVGRASPLVATEFKPVYAERVEKFLRDNSNLGEGWQKEVGKQLYGAFKGVDEKEYITGSNTPAGIFIANHLPGFPLIRGKKLLDLWNQAGNKNLIGPIYLDFGLQFNGEPRINSAQARAFLESLEREGLEAGEGIVPDFYQLTLKADADSGLVYELAKGVKQEELASVSDFPFQGRVGKNGLFRAYLYSYDDWYAYYDNLVDSYDYGRMVCYDAEGVAPKKLEGDLVTTLREKFESI